MIATSRNASSMKRSGIKKTLLNKEAEIPANLSSENHIVVCTQESGLEKHHHAGSGSFDEKMTVITPKATRSRRKSFTSSFIGECAHSFEMDKLPNIVDNTNPLEVVEYVDDIYQYYWSLESNIWLRNAHGHMVVSACLDCFTTEQKKDILELVTNNFHHLSKVKFGCIVVQRSLIHDHAPLFRQISVNVQTLSTNRYGFLQVLTLIMIKMWSQILQAMQIMMFELDISFNQS